MAEAFDDMAVVRAALGLKPEDREAFLLGACPDPQARARVHALLRKQSEEATGFATTQAGPSAAGRIDEFRLIRTLGQGGMGVVYLAEDTVLGRPVALKVLAAAFTGSEQALARFREEARSAAALKHPSIVQVYKFGFDIAGGRHYIACEYVDGCTLADLIDQERERRKSEEGTQHLRDWHRRCAGIIAAIADALDCSHRARIIHRDVKPSNILVDRQGLARLTDFGIAKHLVEDARTLYTGVVGSCHYMSPEQARVVGAKVDQRSDVFSLGVVLYELIALRRPFEGSDVQQVLRAVTSLEPTRLGAVDRLAGRDLETICHKAIEKDPAQRYQTAAHMAADLRCYLAGDPILARPPGLGRRAARLARQYRGPVMAGTIAVLALAAAGAWGGIVHLRNQALAWISVESEVPGCRVYQQAHDPETLELLPTATLLGTAPLRHLRLPPGQYRITVATERGDSFVEFNTILLEPGSEHERVLRATASAPMSPSPIAASAAGAEHTLEGRLVPTGEGTEEMVRVPAGQYVFGWADSGGAIVRRRSMRLPEFWIDRTEVSNREYKRFIDATGHPGPRHWTDYGYDDSAADLPVVGVTLDDAEAYARWRGRRLPTMHEWQAAARGPAGRKYPWGDDFEAGPAMRARAGPSLNDSWERKEQYNTYRRSALSTRLPGLGDDAGPLLHAFDNAHEYSGTVNLPQHDSVILGRYWADPPKASDLSRAWTEPLVDHSFMIGFRCARSAACPSEARHSSGR